MAQFVGSWNLEQAKNVEALFHKIGVTQIKKEHLDNPKGVVTFTLDGNKMTMKMDSPVRKSEVTFTFGVEFEEETFSGQKARSKYTKESDSKIIQVQTTSSYTTHIVREVQGNTMTITATSDNVTAEFIFHKIPHP